MRYLADFRVDPATVNGALIATVAVITFILGFFQRQTASRAKALEKSAEQKQEIYDLKYATNKDIRQMSERITVIETKLGILHPLQEKLEEEE